MRSHRTLSNMSPSLISSTYILQRQGQKSICQCLHTLQSLQTQSAMPCRLLPSLLNTSMLIGCSESDMPGLSLTADPQGLASASFGTYLSRSHDTSDTETVPIVTCSGEGSYTVYFILSASNPRASVIPLTRSSFPSLDLIPIFIHLDIAFLCAHFTHDGTSTA